MQTPNHDQPKLIRKRRRFFAKWLKSFDYNHRLAYNHLRNKIQRAIKEGNNKFILDNLDTISKSRQYF